MDTQRERRHADRLQAARLAQLETAQGVHVKTTAKGQSLEAAGECDPCQALAVAFAQGQSLQAAWKSDIFQALIEFVAEGEGL